MLLLKYFLKLVHIIPIVVVGSLLNDYQPVRIRVALVLNPIILSEATIIDKSWMKVVSKPNNFIQ